MPKCRKRQLTFSSCHERENRHTAMFETLKQFLEKDLAADGSLNPVRLRWARRAYHFQSRVLHIPDRFAFVSPGPPRLQVFEVGALAVVVLYLGCGSPRVCSLSGCRIRTGAPFSG